MLQSQDALWTLPPIQAHSSQDDMSLREHAPAAQGSQGQVFRLQQEALDKACDKSTDPKALTVSSRHSSNNHLNVANGTSDNGSGFGTRDHSPTSARVHAHTALASGLDKGINDAENEGRAREHLHTMTSPCKQTASPCALGLSSRGTSGVHHDPCAEEPDVCRLKANALESLAFACGTSSSSTDRSAQLGTTGQQSDVLNPQQRLAAGPFAIGDSSDKDSVKSFGTTAGVCAAHNVPGTQARQVPGALLGRTSHLHSSKQECSGNLSLQVAAEDRTIQQPSKHISPCAPAAWEVARLDQGPGKQGGEHCGTVAGEQEAIATGVDCQYVAMSQEKQGFERHSDVPTSVTNLHAQLTQVSIRSRIRPLQLQVRFALHCSSMCLEP
jgi:hypothetical protein